MRDCRCELVVVDELEFGAGEDRRDLDTEVAADLGRDDAAVTSDDLDGNATLVELGDRRAGIGLGPVDEREEAGEVQVPFVGSPRLDEPGRLTCGDGDDPGTVGEEPV